MAEATESEVRSHPKLARARRADERAAESHPLGADAAVEAWESEHNLVSR
ncbi:MAG TPA: hypothetical protein VE197_01505 [Mycobacterium sp.]|nr:hypothetical protein [Mycobacterium sp.]